MAKPQRLNKSLIAFLTIMGVVLIVSVATLIVRQGAKRDPEVLARNARTLEQSGDADKLRKAAGFYSQAYAAGQERQVKYLLDTARCFFKLGALMPWIEVLQKAHSKAPNDQTVLTAMLEGMWRSKEIEGRGLPWWPTWRDYSDKLVKLDPNNLLGLVSQAYALWNLGGEDNLTAGNEVIERAYALQPSDPRVAATYVEYLGRKAATERQKAVAGGATDAELQRAEQKFVDEAAKVLAASVAEHSADAGLLSLHARFLQEQSRRAQLAGNTDTAEELVRTARTELERALAESEQALAANADRTEETALAWERGVPQLHLALAQQLMAQITSTLGKLTPERIHELRAGVEEHAQRAIELDPAMYEAYALRAQLKLLGPDENPGAAPGAAEFEGALSAYDDATKATQTLRSLRAMLSETQRLLLIQRAFATAVTYLESVTSQGNPEQVRAVLKRAEGFFEDARTRWPEHPLTDYLRGRLAVANNDRNGAIRAFERALERQPETRWWTDAVQVPTLPQEFLATLYSMGGQWGEAERYARDALQYYTQTLGRVPPLRLLLTEIDVLKRLDRARDALELLDQYRSYYPGEPIVTATRAELLVMVGRREEAVREEKNVVDTGVGTRLWQSRQAYEREDFAEAEQSARGVLADESASDAQFQIALQLLVSVLERTNRHEEAYEYVRSLAEKPPREGLTRLLQIYLPVLAETDPAKRTERLLEAIGQNPDPVWRAEQFFAYYDGKRDFEKALSYVLELRKLQPDDPHAIEREFATRLHLGRRWTLQNESDQAKEQFAKADELLGPLMQANEGRGLDQVGGATYRGQLALVRGQVDLAIRELRQAATALPKSAELQVSLGRAYIAAGRTAEGIEALKRAVLFNPRNLDARGILADTYDELAARTIGPERELYAKEATQNFEALAKLAPTHPYVLEHQQRNEEEAHPLAAIAEREKQRAATPDDTANLERLAELYVKAWSQADKKQDESAKKQLLAQADALYGEVRTTLPEGTQVALVQNAANFYSQAGQREKGEALLRKFRDQQTGPFKLSAQILLARFLEAIKDPDAAEREYQRCQSLVEEVATDPAQRQQLNERVGLALVDFYERWARPTQVVEVCRWLLGRLPEKGEAARAVRMRLVDALLKAGQLGDADVELNDYVKSHGEDPTVLTTRIRLNLARNKRDVARQDLTTLLQRDPENAWALLARGWLSLQRARYEEARGDLMKAKELIGPGNALEGRLHTLLATLHERGGQLEMAVGEWRAQLAALDAEKAPVEQKQQVVGEMVRLFRKANQFDRARQLVSEYMEKDPDEPNWPFLLGELLESRADSAKSKGDTAGVTRDYQAAAGYFQRASEKITDQAHAPFYRSLTSWLNVLVKAGQARQAIDAFQKMRIERPAPALRLSVAKAHWALNDREAAEDHCRRALADGAAAGISLLGLVTNEMRGVLPMADVERLLRAVIELAAPDSDEALRLQITLGEHLVRSDRLPDALPILNTVVEKSRPDSAERVSSILARAQCQERLREIEAAMAGYRDVLQMRPDNILALNNLAYLLVTAAGPGLPRPQEALQYAERLESLMADNQDAANVLDTVGWVYFKYAVSAKERRGHLERALAALEQSLDLESEKNLAAYEHLGQVYRELNRNSEARTMLSRGLDKARQNKDEPAQQSLEKMLKEFPQPDRPVEQAGTS